MSEGTALGKSSGIAVEVADCSPTYQFAERSLAMDLKRAMSIDIGIGEEPLPNDNVHLCTETLWITFLAPHRLLQNVLDVSSEQEAEPQVIGSPWLL